MTRERRARGGITGLFGRRGRANRELRAELEHLAFHDPLTGVANRAAFSRDLGAALDAGGCGAALVILDLDHLKTVNDALGHDVGDELLCEVARRLAVLTPDGATAARLGGDEFAVVLPGATRVAAEAFSRCLVTVLAEPVRSGARSLRACASIGVTVAEAGTDPAVVVQEADLAMYAAKEQRACGVEFFAPRLREAIVERYRIERDLRVALGRDDELLVEYQPIVELATSAIVGVEALVRWDHPQRGVLRPDRFIGVAEASGAIEELGSWVLERACRDLAAWQAQLDLRPGFHVAVNLSPHQLRDARFVDHVAEVLGRHGIAPQRLTLEITEGALMEHTAERMAQLGELEALGVTLALDDFGTGYSSLSYLRDLPASILKIDRAFITGIAREPQEFALAAAIVQLATSAGKQTLAEGIEEGDQLAHLLAVGCRLGQGHLFSPSVPADELLPLLRGGAATAPAVAAVPPAFTADVR